MTATAERKPTDLDAIEREIRGRVSELADRRQQLALDALGSRRAAKELEDVEQRLAGAGAELERLRLARAETERREVEAAEREEAERIAAELEIARRAESARKQAAGRLDRAAKSFAQALAAFHRETCELEAALRRAGGRDQAANAARFRPTMVEGALKRAFIDAEVPGPAFELPLGSRPQPLADLPTLAPSPEMPRRHPTPNGDNPR